MDERNEEAQEVLLVPWFAIPLEVYERERLEREKRNKKLEPLKEDLDSKEQVINW